MATTSFTIDFSTKLDKLRADLGKAESLVSGAGKKMEQAMAGFGRSLGGTVTSMLSFRNVLGTVLGTAGLGLLITRSLDAASAIVDMAQRTGLTTDALQALTHAATQSGASTEDLETGLRNLSRRLSEAAGGQKEAVDLFGSMGIAIKDARGNIIGVDTALGNIADVMKTTASPAERTRLAFEAFGRSGTRLIPMLSEGRAGLAAFADDARRLGLVLDASLLAEAERAGDQLTTLSRVISIQLTRAIAQLAPHIGSLAAALAQVAGSASDFLGKFLSPERAGSDELAQRIAAITEAILQLQAVQDKGLGLGDKLNELFGHDPVGDRQKRLEALKQEREQLRLLLRERLAAETQAQKAPSGGASIFGPKQQQALDEARRILESLNPTLTAADRKVLELGKRFDDLAEQAGPASAQVRAIGEQAKLTTVAVGQLDVWTKIVDDFEKALPSFDAGERAIEAIREKFREAALTGPPALRETILALGEVLITEKAKYEATQIAIKGIGEAYEQAESAAQAYASFVKQLRQPIEDLDDAIAQHQTNLDALAVAHRALAGTGLAGQPTPGQAEQGAVEQQIQNLARRRAELNALLEGVEVGSERFTELTGAIDAADTELGALSEKLRTLVGENRTAQLAADFDLIDQRAAVFGEHLEAITEKIARNRQEITAMLASSVPVDDARITALQTQNESLERQAKIATFVGESIRSAMTTASDTIVDAFLRGELAAVKWGDVVQDILADIIKKLIQVFIVEVAIKAIQGVASSAFGGGGGGGEIALMAGGIVTRPTHALIGEAGPEAVIPLDRLTSGGGGDVTINIHPPAGTETRTQESTDSRGSRSIDIFITKLVQKGMDQGAFDGSLARNFGMSRQGARR